jgi:hypothetical protein
MMGSLAKKMGAVGAAPYVSPATQIDKKGTPCTYSLPAQYRKPNRYALGDQVLALQGGRALLLDLLINAKPAGIDRASTLQWLANISDTVGELRARGIAIETRKGLPAHYELISDVRRIGGAP